MKISKLFSLAALALMMTACSDQIEQVQQPRNTEGIPFTATISTEGHAATRLLAESGTSITATWASGEKVALIYTVGTTTYLEEATVTPQTDGTATISTTLEGSPVDDTDVTIVYPASAVDKSTKDVKTDLLTSQNGLLTGTGSISDKYDLRKTSTPAKLKIDGTTASLKGTVSLAQQVSIWKLTLQSGGSSLSAKALAVKDASDNLLASATLATAGSVFYMAVPAMTSAKIIAANGANSYSYSKASVSISAGKYYQSTVSLTQDEYTDLSATATANTYIISSAGKYKFNATIKGNGGLDPLTGTTATPISKSSIAGVKVLWELNDYGKAIKYSSSAYDISYLDGYVYFSTPETFESGDAYVAIYDSSDEILWSWLIWATPEPGTVNVTTKASAVYQFMDRNLGAIGDGKYEAGFNYQWGRKDPFPGNRGSSYGGTYVYSPERMTSHSIYKNLMTVDYSVAHPTTYASPNTNSHWVVEADYRSNIWYSGTAKTIYDPCPQGWRVPTKDEMDHTESSTGWLGAGFIGDCNTDFGYGNAGAGYYWTSTSESWNQVWGWYNDSRKLVQDNHQRNGFSIRPVKEPGPATSKSLTSLTTDEIGWRIGSDGKAYSPTGALPAGVTAEAMIAYVGSASDCTHGLAIEMENLSYLSNTIFSWNNSQAQNNGKTAAEIVTAWSTDHAISGGTWRLPTLSDWEFMLGLTSYTIPITQYIEGSGALNRKMNEAGGTCMMSSYWAATLNDTKAYSAGFPSFSGDVYNAVYLSGNADPGAGNYIRACFAF